ncbi:MAG: SDR family oxidoreductase [Victivallales bacterium]|nr:SDR family oxidoreductase [Victivallales bacterium]MCF7888681.1 SDR family oxidoreductase [Victivallales bacterium]
MNNLKTALITGGAVRIGSEISIKLAENGFNTIIHCMNSVNEAETLCRKLNSETEGEHKIFSGNLLDENVRKRLFEENTVDILINNASVYKVKPIIKETLKEAQRQFEVNYWVPYCLMKLFKEQNIQNGLILNLLDCAVSKLDKNSSSYLLSKKSLAELTKLTALQWAPEIRVNGIAPGFVMPPSWLSKSDMQKSIEAAPMKKKTDLNDITEACVFLIKNQSITGEILFVDGGVKL